MANESSIKYFNRLNDKINADEYAKILYDEKAIDEYFSKYKVSSKDLEQIKRYSAILGNAIMKGDESIKYTVNDKGIKGFSNILGYNNIDSKGEINDKLWGYAVGYAVNKLNDMDVYQEPTKTPDSTKLKYSKNALGTLFTRALFNKDGNLTKQDIIDFLDLDELSENTRSLSERVKKSISVLDLIKSNYLNQLDENWTDELKKELETNLNNLYTIFQSDNTLTNNEFLDFGNYSGLDRNLLRKLYATDFSTPTLSESEVKTPLTLLDKRRWIRLNYGNPYTGELMYNIGVDPGTITLGSNTETLVSTSLKSTSTEDLLIGLSEMLSSSGDITSTDFYKSKFSYFIPLGVSADYIFYRILNELKDRQDSPLYSFGDSKYYIHGFDTGRNTGIVWNSNAKRLEEISKYLIPYWQNEINNKWELYANGYDYDDPNDEVSKIWSHKSGGILKAKEGVVMNRPLDWLNIDNTTENAKDSSTWDNYFKIDEIIKKILEDTPNTLIKTAKDSNTPLILEIAAKLDKIAKDNNLTFDPKDGLKGYKDWNKAFQETGYNEYFGDDSSLYDMLGPSTYNRLLLIKKLANMANPKVLANQVINNEIDNIVKEAIKEEQAKKTNYKLIKDQVDLKTNNKEDNKENDFLGGEPPKEKGSGINWKVLSHYANDFFPYITNTAMLFDSLHTNRKVEDLQRRTASLLNLKNYQHQVTGDFATLQEGERTAAQTESLGSRMAANTADADKGNAYMLEANKLANDQRWRTFLADNAEIKRNADIAELMAIKTMENHIDVANKNALSLNETNTFNRLNTAQRLQHDQQSRANFGKSLLELYWNAKADRENKERELLNFKLTLANQDSEKLLTDATNKFEQAYYDWINFTDINGNLPNKNKSLTDFMYTKEGKKAQSWINLANRYNTARSNVIYNDYYKTDWKDPYEGKYVLDYTKTYAKKGAKLIPRRK